MNVNFKFLLLGTSLSLIPNLTQAQCVATTDCASLGYTQTSCPNGKGIKCPFGNTFACPATDESVCDKNGFKYECKGSNEKPGDYACSGKFNACKCQSGYTWKDGKCSSGMSDCVVGAIYYADDTCSTNLIENKFPLGVVVYADGKGHGQVMALNYYRGADGKTIHQQYSFHGRSDNYIQSDTNMTCYAQEAQAKADLASCWNMDMMNNAMDEVIAKKHAEGNTWVNRSYIFTLVNDVNSYNEQKPWGRKWCIPSLGTYIKMADKLAVINNAMYKAGGEMVDTQATNAGLLTSTCKNVKNDNYSTEWWTASLSPSFTAGGYFIFSADSADSGSVRLVFEF